MNITLAADPECWLALPASFPTRDGLLPREWENAVVDRMSPVWADRWDAAAEAAAREALRHGLQRVLPQDTLTLQFWPTAAVANAVVHVVIQEFGPEDRPVVVPVDEGDYLTAPVVSAFETDRVGTGVEARFLFPSGAETPSVLAGVTYALENTRHGVYVIVEPTLPQMIGVMLEPLRDMVRGMRLTPEAGEDPWEPCSVDPAVLETHEETWPFEGMPAAR